MLKRKKNSQTISTNHEQGGQSSLYQESNETVENSISKEYLSTLLSRVEDTAINIGIELAKNNLIKADTSEEELLKISISALSPLALNVAEHVSELSQNPNSQHNINQMAYEIIVNNHSAVALSARFAKAANNSRPATKKTIAALQEAIAQSNPSSETRIKIAGELSKNIVNSYLDTTKKISPSKTQNSRNCVNILLPNPLVATTSTDPVILGVASIIAVDSAIEEAKKDLDYPKTIEKIEHSNDIISRFKVALSAQLAASDIALGQSPRTKKSHQIQQSLNLINAQAAKALTASSLGQVVAENLKPVVPQQPNPVLVDIYIKDELDVSEIPVDYAEKVLSNPQQFKNSDSMPTNSSEQKESQILQKPSTHKNAKRAMGATATAATMAAVSMVNFGSPAQAAPINPGSVAASVYLPTKNSAKSMQFSFNESQNLQDETSASSETQHSLGLEEGALQPESTIPSEQVLAGATTETDNSLGIPAEDLPSTNDSTQDSNNADNNASTPSPQPEETQSTEQTEPVNPTTNSSIQDPLPPDSDTENPEDSPAENPADTSPTTTLVPDNQITDQTVVSPIGTEPVLIEDIFSPDDSTVQPAETVTDPSNVPEPTTEEDPTNLEQPTEPAVIIYPATPTNESANEHIVIELNPASITEETAVPAPQATQVVEQEQIAIILEDKSQAHKLSLNLAEQYTAENYNFNQNDINSYLEALTKDQLRNMLSKIDDSSKKIESKKQVDELIAYAKLISERPGLVENAAFLTKVESLIKSTPKAYKKQPALYALLLNNSQEAVGTNEKYLNGASTSSATADRYIKLLTTAAVANASDRAIAELPSFNDSYQESNGNQSNNTEKVEIKVNESALKLAVEKYAQADVKSNPEKLEYFQNLILAIAKEAAKSHADVNLSVVAAQGALETGWGVHAHGNNLFGIKAGSDWDGPVFKGKTWEVINGQRIDAELAFRAYKNPEESVADRLKLVGPGHQNFEKGCAETVDSYLRSLQHETGSGPKCKILVRGKLAYATDPSYETTIKSIIANNNIEQIFKEGGLGDYAKAIYAERQNQAERSNRGNEFGRKPEVTIPHGQKVAEQAREWVKSDPTCSFADDGTCFQRCLNIVRKAWSGVTGKDGLKDYSAYDAYQRYKQNGWVNKSGPIPVGAIMWSANLDKIEWGHVYIYLGNGKVASNDVSTPGLYSITELNNKNTIWNTHTFLGWSAYHG